MKILLKQKVKGNYKDIFEKFDKKLFEYLTPDFPKIELIDFGSSKKGNIVHLRFKFPLYSDWISEITEDKITDEEAYFIDVGKKLPPPIKEWHHKHIVRKVDENVSEIIDEINFKSYFGLLTLLVFPGLFVQFYPRKRLYRKYFGEVN